MSDVINDKGKEELAEVIGDRLLMDRDELINEIVKLEWPMFDKVENFGGRASCQDDYLTFHIMRASQFSGWNDKMLLSYIDDFEAAILEGRNLLTEKYAYMMERTDPDGYAAIKDILPPVSAKKQELIDSIAAVSVEWQRELFRRFPKVTSGGRKLTSAEDTAYPSFETYLKGELSTYSEATLRAYKAHADALAAEGKNMNEMVLAATAASYGYDSIEAAEAARA
jgi:hypothetical protein